jgi:deoxyguanosine kinase
MFIVFEGVDASGKTTISKLLADCLGGVHYVTPPKRYLTQREEVDRNANAEEHFRFYLLGIREASAEIWELLSEGRIVVADRYWVSTYVYHVVMGAKVTRTDFSGIVLPNATVLLTVSPEVQAYRFVNRGMSAGDRRMLNQQEILAREFRKALVAEKNLVALDTSNLTPSGAVAQVLADLSL